MLMALEHSTIDLFESFVRFCCYWDYFINDLLFPFAYVLVVEDLQSMVESLFLEATPDER